MSDEFQTEEEQIEAIKRWWKENGRSIILGLVIGVGGIGGYRYWQSSVEEQAMRASVDYEQVINLAEAGKKEFLDKALQMEAEQGGSSYADLTAFVAAKKLVQLKEYDKAKEQLEWIIANSKQDAFIHIARIRLAKLLLQLNRANEALELVKDVKPEGFDSIYAELKADIYASLKAYTEAKAGYQLALSTLSQGDRRRATIEMKANSLPAVDVPVTRVTEEK